MTTAQVGRDESAYDQQLASVLEQHRGGRIEQAKRACHEVLAACADHPTALYLAALLDVELGELATAEGFCRKLVSQRPDHAESHVLLGRVLQLQGDAVSAVASLDRALAIEPGHEAAHIERLSALRDAGRMEAAIQGGYSAAGRLPGSAAVRMALGSVLASAGRYGEAESAYAGAAALDPGSAAAQLGRALALIGLGRHPDALVAADLSLALDPGSADGWYLRGTALKGEGADALAADALRTAVQLAPLHASAHLNLGNLLIADGDWAAGERHLRQAVQLNPDLHEAWTSLAFLLAGRDQVEEATLAAREARALAPASVPARATLSLALLRSGDFPNGLAEHDAYRWDEEEIRRYDQALGARRWRGEPIADKDLLVYAAEGLGDTIQFSRYLKLLAAAGARVRLMCDRPLIPLLARLPGLGGIHDKAGPPPPCDFWIEQMSLPWRLGSTLGTLPGCDGDLQVDPDKAAAWNARLPAGRRLGVVWAGNPAHHN
ncbi:MAG: tetratricopeptide repeat protein, partial [Caulobacteraceae bacterium]